MTATRGGALKHGFDAAYGGGVARLSAIVIMTMLAVQIIFNLVAHRLGWGYPWDRFLNPPDDRFADFLKAALEFPGAPLHPFASHEFRVLMADFAAQVKDFEGTVVNPDHMPPLSTFLAYMARQGLAVMDGQWLLAILLAIGLGILASVVMRAAGGRYPITMALVVLLASPTLMMIDRAHFFSLIGATAMIYAVGKTVNERGMSWPVIIAFAIAANIRPNLLIVPAFLLLAGRASWRDLFRLGAVGAGLAVGMLAIDHALYPHYTLETWLTGLQHYRERYVILPITVGFNNSLQGALHALFGFSGYWNAISIALLGPLALLTWTAAREGRLGAAPLAFAALALPTLGTAVLADYHLIAFTLVIAQLVRQGGARDTADRVVLAAALFVLVPKNYIFFPYNQQFWWSLQVLLNPAALLAALAAVAWLGSERGGAARRSAAAV